ncbi:MAG: tRNA (adenosine(37)-N6)-threonylcarbamoyltransferase complex ATPase subunit type 1 TsaE [Pirellulaceae bacterium]
MSTNSAGIVCRAGSEDDSRQIAEQLARGIELEFDPANGGAMIFLNGTLGSGKTFFVQALLSDLGVDDEIVSPTFTICVPHRAKDLEIWHMDAYRIEHDEEVDDLGLDEALSGGKLILVEWGEKIAKLAPPQDLEVQIEVLGQSEREFQFRAKSELGRALISHISQT